LDVKFNGLKLKYEAGTMKPKGTQVFEVSEWLVPDNRKKTIKQIITDVYKKAGTVKVKASTTGAKKKVDSTSESAEACSAALAMFKKSAGSRGTAGSSKD